MICNTRQPFTFSDGTCISPGTWVGACALGIHGDPSIYPDPQAFDGFRFAKMREKDDLKNHFTETSTNWLYFGYGKHAW